MVDIKDECIESWRCKNANGYPVKHNKDGSRLVHRMIYEEFNGLLPKEICILHKCDNPTCINPNHLFAGTREDNIRDMCYKGRQNTCRGIKHWSSTLTSDQVHEIRLLYNTGNYSQRKLGKIYNVTHTCIGGIVRNKFRKEG